MGQCCSKRQDVERDEPHVEKPTQIKVASTIEVASPQVPFERYHESKFQYENQGNNDTSPSSSPTKDLYDSSITSSKYIYTSPPSSPSKSSQEPQTEELEQGEENGDYMNQRNEVVQTPEAFVRPEDRPIESLFIREERKRLAQIQEQLRLEREAANEKWVNELNEKKKEFLPESNHCQFSPRVN